jgi:transmembrane sensor
MMSPHDDKVRDLISQEAAEWFVANRDGLSSKDRQAFFSWLRTSPAHVEEYLAYAVMARDLHKASEYSDAALAELLASARTDPEHISPLMTAPTLTHAPWRGAPGWQRASLVSVACAMAGVAWVALRFVWPARVETPADLVVETHEFTRHGQQKSIRLADDSILHLNTASDVTIRYSGRERVAIINAGEADFEVVHETGRPFRVVAGSTQIIDRGTKFDVLRAPDSTVITVIEGSVLVRPAISTTAAQVLVDANHQLIVADGIWPPGKLILVDAEKTTAWLHRQITFNHASLDKVAAEFNRYTQKRIEIISPSLKTFEISGVFSTDDTAAFIAFLRSLDRVRVEETPTQIRVFEGAK